MRAPIVSLHRVSPSGSVELVAANVPYSSLLWTRRLSSPGEYELSLACPCPVEWPGRYLVTVDGHDECGVVEKVVGDWVGGARVTLSGRFAECLWARYALGAGGEVARGASWRQAVTSALSSWHMSDIPPLSMGEGTEAATGSSYVLSGAAGDLASDVIYGCTAANGFRPLVGYDRDSDVDRLSVRLADGLDRTRSQSDRPWCVFSVELASADAVSYSGDYSPSCSSVVAHAERDRGDEGVVSVTRAVSVPGFDAASQWQARAYEDVTSLVDPDADPTADSVERAGALRAYDHMPALSVDCSVTEAGYRDWWDLGDLVEVEVPELDLVSSARVEEVREAHDEKGFRLEATVGTKSISRARRATMGRR